MALSAVEICNSALHKIGARRISSLSDGTKEAIILNDMYDRLRKEVLRSHPWNFAIAYVALSETVNTPVWPKWSKEFLLPSDVLRVLEVEPDYDAPWEVGYNTDGNKVIFSTSTSMKIKYIKDITNTTLFAPDFDEALAFRIAADIAYTLVQSQTVQANMFQAYKDFLAQARSFDAQEKSYQSIESEDFTSFVRG
jgi:hypothetical protein